jgi:predicted metalloprotease with PDZ domain
MIISSFETERAFGMKWRGFLMRFAALAILFLFVQSSNAQDAIQYRISFENAIHHEAEISVAFSDVGWDTLETRMSRSSPGRYAIHEFAKNVYNVKATDGRGNPLPITRPNPYQWDISGHDGTVRITYTLYGDRAGGTYSGIDETHAHLNIPATFMWARGLGDRPIEVEFVIPDESNWKVATQLAPAKSKNIFWAPNLDYFMDSPTELSDFTLREWPVESNGKQQTIRMAVHHDGTESEVDIYAKMAAAVIDEEKAVFGELPEFDYGAYTFIVDYLPYVAGDGMEHRNSTICAGTRPIKTRAARNLGTVAHEFFHAWNVERMRPKSLEPFDLERANMSGELWFAEGFTSYYTSVLMRRAGIISLDRYARGISGGLNPVINSPGRNFFTPVEMSMHAPFVDAATAVDPNNRRNTFISYYTYGSAIGLGLDLTLRTKFRNITLDDYMRAVWAAHGKTEIPYTLDDLRSILGKLTVDYKFSDEFFDRYVEGHEVVDYKSLLAHAGLLLRREDEEKAFLGYFNLDYSDQGAKIRSATIMGSPIYQAGLDRGDLIIELDGVPLKSAENFESVRNAHKPGDIVMIEFKQRGQSKESQITFVQHPRLEVVPYEHVATTVTSEIKEFREKWLGSKSTKGIASLQKICPVCKRHYLFEYEYCKFDGEGLAIE